MYYMYVLKGRMQRKLYIGSTNDLRRRLDEHARKESTYTSKASDWQLVYYEAYRNREDARERAPQLLAHLAQHGVLASGLYRLRFVTHLDVDEVGIDHAIAVLRDYFLSETPTEEKPA